ncbi:MAG: NAD(P)/FAD-dependent oxidoreductase [Actinomycetota bacterium]
MSKETFVIVGASLAGAKAAERLRTEGFDGGVVLIGAEQVRPYERPPLSKAYLRGEQGREKVYIHSESFYTEHDIELMTGTVVSAVDPNGSAVTLDNGRTIGYDRLLICTGADPRPLQVPGADLAGVRYLRSIQDSDDLRAAIEAASQVVVIGAGWIGAEVAASARQMGREVALVGNSSVPLERVLGEEVGRLFLELHKDHGIDLHMNSGVESLVGASRVEGVRTDKGEVIPGDLVVIGVGAVPRVGLALQAGVEIENGIVVDQHLQSSVPNIYAAGDVANAFHPLYQTHLRVEHISNARHQGMAAGRNMLGQQVTYQRIPFFYSDQYELGMEYSGYATEWDDVVYRGDREKREFICFWVSDGRVLAGMNVNVWQVADKIQALVRSQQPVDLARLADPDVPLDELLPAVK